MYADRYYSPFDEFFGGDYLTNRRPQRHQTAPVDPFFPFHEVTQPQNTRRYRQNPQPQRRRRGKPQPTNGRRMKQQQQQQQQEELLNESVITIQKAFRSYAVRKLNILENLRRLDAVEEKVSTAYEKFSDTLEEMPDLKGEKLRMTYAEYEEALTRGLLELDSILTHGVDIVRDSRKDLVTAINAELAKIDAKKPEIKASVEEEQRMLEEERRIEAEKTPIESEESSSLEMSNEVIDSEMEIISELQEKLRELEEEERKMDEEKQELDRMQADWTKRMTELQANKDALEERFQDYNMNSMHL